jgi:membrane-associated phospholipid phosphatase
MSLGSFVVSGIFTQVIKFSTHRHRPDAGNSRGTWDGPGFSNSNLSFPSGHSSTAFSIATVIASEYNDIEFVPPLAYGIATLTALSRVNDNGHWASDVFLGSAIGYFTAKAVVNLHKYKENRNLSILPMTNGEYAGLVLTYKF